MGRYAALTQRLVETVLSTPGATTSELRRAVLERKAVPPPLASYVDQVARRAYTVTDGDVAALARAGQTEEAIFEITVLAAVGAALDRLEIGLAALRGEEPD
jgi:alkylhydroperoxidase family enzyme